MILTDLRISNKNPLMIDFYTNIEVVGKSIKINDIGLITNILDYFFKNCDEHTSPQCLWSVNDIDYITLMLDYNNDKKEHFNKVLNHIKELLSYEHTKKDKITSIWISYPKDWTVKYICEHI